jgi:hypothetical protein
MTGLLYYPPPTIEKFMLDDSLVRCLVGPIGSGKSMGCIVEMLRRARTQKPDANGVRYTRMVCVRNTMRELRSTVLTDIQQYLNPMIRYFVTDSTVQIRAELDDGTTVWSDWLLVPLDTKEDQHRLLSMQLTMAWVNEVREVPIEILSALLGRLGRYPSKVMGGPTFFGLVADTNPWDTDSPYHERFVLNPSANWKLFHQPSGIGPYAENVGNLPPGYYANLLSDRDDGWSDVHIRSEWGTSNAGQAVFRRSFDATVHVRDMQAVVNPGRPVCVAMDFGRTPTALITQTDNYGRLLIYKEVLSEDMGLVQMVGEKLKPILQTEPFVGKRFYVIADPAGREKGQVTEESPFDALKSMGFLVYPAPTNNVAPRLIAVERALKSTLGGEPGVQISREGCPGLIRALGNTYRYRKKRDGTLEDLPEKNHPASDLADCLQYACLGNSADIAGRVIARYTPRAQAKKFTAAAWT